MNRIFRLVWNESLNAYVPAAETARGRGKSSKRKLIAAVLSLSATIAQAGPTGGQVTGGSGTITQSGATTTIQQASQNLSLNWQTFNIAPQDTVNFVQPNAAAIAVNRILDPNGSVILGHLNANGQVYLINPNGVLFGKGAEVNVGGLVASTLELHDGTPGGSSESFSGTGAGSIVNDGTLTAATGGAIALLGNHVSNTGVISAQLGTVAMGAGSAATLTFHGSRLVGLQIDQSVLNNVAANGGLIRADGGQVLMTAGAQKALLASVVNNTGIIEARTLENHEGMITLLGGMTAGSVNVGGTLDASAPSGGNGGSIETSAAHVKVADTGRITTAAAMGLNGTWTIDPDGFTIAASGGDMTGAALTAALANGVVNILSTSGSGSDGNVNVNDAVSWSANKLALTATNDVNINAVMTATGTASLDLAPGSNNVNVGFNPDGSFKGRVDFSGSGTLRMNVAGTLQTFTVINSLGAAADATSAPATATLQGAAASANLGGYLALGSNIDASQTASWNACSTCNNGAAGHYGFTPIGNGGTPFTGIFDGLGHTISNVTINQYVGGQAGLFAQLGSNGNTAPYPTIRNIGLLGGSVTAGSANGGSISSSTYAGSLVGVSYGVVRNSFSSAVVNGYTGGGFPYLTVGGLVGANYGLVSNSHATGPVSNNQTDIYGQTGGLVGSNSYQGTIDRSYATGNVTGIDGSSQLGGLVGTSNTSTISNSYATGNVSAGANSSYLGGLAGGGSTITNSYATGNVTGGDGSYRLGGLAGLGGSGASVTNSFATGNVKVNGATGGGGNADLGGLMGAAYGNVQNSYATGNITVTGVNSGPVGGLVGLLSVGSVTNSYSTGSLISAGGGGGLVGAIANGGAVSNSFWNTTTSGSTVSAGGTGMTTAQMQAQANFTTATIANGSVNPTWDFGSTWTIYEGQTTPLLQVFMTPLTVSGTAAQTYNASPFAPTSSTLAYSMTPDLSHLFGTVSITGTALGASHAGTYSFTPGGLYSDQLGYMITYAAGSLTINPAPLTVVGSTANKIYDGTRLAPLSGGTLSGVFGADAVTLTQTGTFASKNVGTGIAITANDSIGGASAGDYTLVEPTGVTGTITPATLTVSGTTVGGKVYNGTTAASLTGGSLVGVISGDTVTLNQSGTFASAGVGSGIAVTATDSLSGTSAFDYSITEPTGLTGSILPASNPPNSSSGLMLAALNARTQIVENFIYPQLGANPHVINPSPTIAVLATSADGASDGATGSHQAIAVNVSMKIGANGTLKIENGGLRLPSNLVVGNE